MKVGILTQPLRFNYGGILQNWALQNVLCQLGHEAITLDPRRYTPLYELPYRFVRHLGAMILRKNYNRGLLPEIHRNHLTQTKGMNTFLFIDNYINRREVCSYRSALCNEFDAFVVGSDQVWRPKYNPYQSAMFLDFTQESKVKKIAYAASFGTDDWEFSQEETNLFRELIKSFDAISVREDSGVNLCKSNFSVEPKLLLDPTLLLNKNDYQSLVNSTNIKRHEGNLFVSFLDYSEPKIRLVEKLSVSYKLTPFFVNSRVEDNSAELKDQVQPPVEVWLRGFEDADCVVTDSFHVCVFSIIYNKPFIALGNIERGLCRFESLFRLLDLDKQLIMDTSNIDDINFEIAYNNVNAILDAKRKESIEFLKNQLSS